MRKSTAEPVTKINQFGENLTHQDALVNRPTRLSGDFGEPDRLPLPRDYDTNAARLAGRINAANISKQEFDGFINEHRELVDKKLARNITKSEERRLLYVRWNLDRIEDALYGEEFDRLERGVVQFERYCDGLSIFIDNLKLSREKRVAFPESERFGLKK